MTLLKDLTLAAIYDFLGHKGEMILKSATPSFEPLVRESLSAAVGYVREPPPMARDTHLDRRLKGGFTHEDGTVIANLVKSYVSSLSPEAGEKGGGRFIEAMYEKVTDNFPLRAVLKASAATKSLILEILRGNDKEEKVMVIPLLAEIGSEEAGLLLHDYLFDPDLDLRIAAVSAVGGARSPSSVPYLLRLLKDNEMQMRWGAVNALMQIGSREAIDALIDVLMCEESEPVRVRAIEALAGIGATVAADKLAEIAGSHPDPVCCGRAREAEAKIRGQGR